MSSLQLFTNFVLCSYSRTFLPFSITICNIQTSQISSVKHLESLYKPKPPKKMKSSTSSSNLKQPNSILPSTKTRKHVSSVWMTSSWQTAGISQSSKRSHTFRRTWWSSIAIRDTCSILSAFNYGLKPIKHVLFAGPRFEVSLYHITNFIVLKLPN